MLQLRALLAQARPSSSQLFQITCSICPELVHRKLSSGFEAESNSNPTESHINPPDASSEVKRVDSRHPHPVIDRMVRVNQAGERSAVMIYAGQLAFLTKQEDRDTVKVKFVLFFLVKSAVIL